MECVLDREGGTLVPDTFLDPERSLVGLEPFTGSPVSLLQDHLLQKSRFS